MTERYQSQYTDIAFERRGLFKLIQKRFQPREVLYPGCSVHITPAFYFPHVVFVDKDPAAQAFFADRSAVYDLVNRCRLYRRSPYIQFIAQDFTEPMPLRRDQFDLLLSLFTGGINRACVSYLKKGGILLTNDHQGDAEEAASRAELSLIGVVRSSGKKYYFSEADVMTLGLSRSDAGGPKRYLRQTSSGVAYVENETYYIFRKLRSSSPDQMA